MIMKKFLMAFVLCCMVSAVMGAENCNLVTGNKLTDIRSQEEVFYTAGGGYVCDKDMRKDECPYLSVIIKNGQAVYCKDQSGYTDTWYSFEDSIRACTDADMQAFQNGKMKRSGDLLMGTSYVSENDVFVCKSKTCYHNSMATGTFYIDYWLCRITGGEKPVVQNCTNGGKKNITSKNNCKSTERFECTDRSKDGKCVCGKCLPDNAQVDPLEKCLNSRNTTEGKACCYLPNSVATWDGKNCNCVGKNMEFKVLENGRGQCFVKEVAAGEKFECDATILAQLDIWAVECATKFNIIEFINKIKELCASETRTVEQFNLLYATLLALNPGDCVEKSDASVTVVVDNTSELLLRSRRKISDAYSVLQGMQSGFDVSVWKDKEGNFNKARLASDSVAAVVLGTTGALVTSHVVKKNQVENGFEDIKCTIGGQTVADWGDEFRVGIQ